MSPSWFTLGRAFLQVETMRIRSVAYSAILATVFAASVHAQSGAPLRVFASNGFRAVFEDLGPRCEKTIGRQLSTDFGTSASLQQRVKGGEAFDVAVMTSDAIDDLVKGVRGSASVFPPARRSPTSKRPRR
jgi:ABC-type molybdate transport system substrate-binding protein